MADDRLRARADGRGNRAWRRRDNVAQDGLRPALEKIAARGAAPEMANESLLHSERKEPERGAVVHFEELRHAGRGERPGAQTTAAQIEELGFTSAGELRFREDHPDWPPESQTDRSG